MSRFDLYPAQGEGRYVVDLQSDFLESYETRIVAPIVPLADFAIPAKGLNPVVSIDGAPHVVQTHFLGAVPRTALKTPVGTLADQADQITRALDILFQGY